ncbi:MAG: SGNH/GDSL hydrolase family protein [Firmicutes bacterium]|nr:SGNH/GDSL hydrolase family protein [Bacillota bacterium]
MMHSVFILGDSYSTFAGCIPQGYPSYYSPADLAGTGVISPAQTWWQPILARHRCRLVCNCSYSGSTICNTGYAGQDYSDISFVGRLTQWVSRGGFTENTVDTVFIFGGTNDTWAGSPIGEAAPEEMPNLYAVFPACNALLHMLRENLPKAQMFWILEPAVSGQVAEAVLDACGKYGVQAIRLKSVEKINGHPTAKGMASISDQVEACLEKNTPKEGEI